MNKLIWLVLLLALASCGEARYAEPKSQCIVPRMPMMFDALPICKVRVDSKTVCVVYGASAISCLAEPETPEAP